MKAITNRCFDELKKIICSCQEAACSERRGLLAMAMERVARELAADAIRGMTHMSDRQLFAEHGGVWRVGASLPQADGLIGLAFSTEEEAKTWREKAIAMAVDAAAVKR